MEFLMEKSHRMQQECNQAQAICFKYQLAYKNNNTRSFSIVKLTTSSCTGFFYVALNPQKSIFVLGCYYLILQSHPVEAERSTEKRKEGTNDGFLGDQQNRQNISASFSYSWVLQWKKKIYFFLIALKPIHGMPAQGAGILQAGSACRPKQRAKQLCCSVHTVAPREAWAQPCAKCVHVLQITTLACLQALLLFIPSPPSIFLTSPCSCYRLKY